MEDFYSKTLKGLQNFMGAKIATYNEKQPSVIGNILTGKQWNQGIPDFGGVLPKNQMTENPNIISPVPAPDQLTQGLIYKIKNDERLANQARVQSNFQPKTIQYPNWVANAPTGVTPTPTATQQTPVAQQIPIQKSAFADFKDFQTAPVPSQFANIIIQAAKRNNVNPNILASLLFSESGIQNKTVPNASGDYGIAQINLASHPNITQQQAQDPNFAIPWAAQTLAGHIQNMGNINRGIAAYNVGEGGASVNGPYPSGLGPKGQAYLNKVGRGLSPLLRKQLGIIISE